MLATGEQPESAGMKILIVDDHVLIREALRGVLKELNAQAAITTDTNRVAEALEVLREPFGP